jgi:SAM-dependent methyltransferase
VELGARLAALARDNLGGYANVTIEVNSFENAELGSGDFDLVLSATAFHWVDPRSAIRKSLVFRPGGCLALVTNAHVAGGTQDVIAEVFCRVSPEVATRRFAERIRHQGHRDAERLCEVESWIELATPLRIGPVLNVDTNVRVDIQEVARWVRACTA